MRLKLSCKKIIKLELSLRTPQMEFHPQQSCTSISTGRQVRYCISHFLCARVLCLHVYFSVSRCNCNWCAPCNSAALWFLTARRKWTDASLLIRGHLFIQLRSNTGLTSVLPPVRIQRRPVDLHSKSCVDLQ